MKTSFYFVLWIVIYPLLGLFHNQFIDTNSFIIAIFAVWGVSYLIKNAIPGIISYQNRIASYPLLEDVYKGNVAAFTKNISRRAIMSVVAALYFIVTTVVIVITFFSDLDNWLAVILFIWFAFNAMKRSVVMVKIKTELRNNPTPQNCAEIIENQFRYNYTSYYNLRQSRDYAEMYLPRPKGLVAFRLLSLLFAAAAAVLGVWFIIPGVESLFNGHTFMMKAVAGMYFLYGSLATYYGISDLIDIVRSFKH